MVTSEIWNSFDGKDQYTAESLQTEGFIHCSFLEQLDGVLKRYYSDAESVVILEIDPSEIDAEVKLEKATDDELFPHIYGPINLNAVAEISLRNLSRKEEQTIN
ncbi:MAG: DUF952 domain-containing protein [Acidobacteriota bacterium]|nr:DUF952 domain-containing protein [Acidobacteriota bacterium]MDH3528719.1 DUF952 domain-containing protein [Acidobacteriota bacterium]